MEYIYDIFLDDFLVGDSGDEIFDEHYQAVLDAEEYIDNYLAEEYGRVAKDFEIVIYNSTREEK